LTAPDAVIATPEPDWQNDADDGVNAITGEGLMVSIALPVIDAAQAPIVASTVYVEATE
jgi:hypothetical protein